LSRPRAVYAENSASGISGQHATGVHDVVPLRIGALVGDFQVAGVIHRGEAGFVYVATDRTTPAKVAVKEYLPTRIADRMADGYIGVRSLRHQTSFRDGLRGFLRQARILGELDEPALVKTLSTWQQHGTAYMAMPLCEGRTLEQAFRESPRPSEPWLKTMLGPLLDALATLHRIHCYPCDVTPHNIVVSDGGPLLFDIGFVRRIVARSPQGRIAVLDHGYAAIEQSSFEPSLPEGPWTDVYAVSSLLHRAITGNPPPSPATRIDSDTMPPLSGAAEGYSESFLEAVERGLAVRPQHRPQSIAEFRDALGIRSLESVDVGTRTSQPTPLPPPAELARTAEPRCALPEVDAQKPALTLQTAKEARLSVASRILGGSLFVAVLAGLGLVWMFSSPEKLARADGDPTSTKPVSTTEQSSADASAPTPAAPADLMPAPILSSVASDQSGPAGVGAHEPGVSKAASKAGAPAPKTGKIQFAIKPWGEIVIDGRSRGVSPPVKELSLPEGRHRIEIRNGTFSGYAGEVDVQAGRSVYIAHTFASP